MLTVHVGLHKTGSTSIQTVLSLEKGHIRRKQLYLRWNDLFVTDGHVRTCNVDRIIALSRRGWHVVVSSEGALGPMTQAYPRAAEVAAELTSLFADIPLRMVLYLRPQHHWAESAYWQHRKEGGDSSPDAFAQTLLASRGFHHAALVRDLSEALPTGALVVRPYEATTDVVGDFFDRCSLGLVPPAFAGLRANATAGAQCDTPDSPFSPAVQQLLHRHFREDWGLLADSHLPAVDGVRSDLFDMLATESTAGRLPRPVAAIDRPAGDVVEKPSGPAPLEQRVRLARQRSVWTVRHGARHLLLGYLASRDAGQRSLPRAPHRDVEPAGAPPPEFQTAGREGPAA